LFAVYIIFLALVTIVASSCLLFLLFLSQYHAAISPSWGVCNLVYIKDHSLKIHIKTKTVATRPRRREVGQR